MRGVTTQVPLESWQVGPWNRWAYVHVDEVVDTVPVPRGDGPVAALERAEGGLDDVVAPLFETAYADGLAVVHRGRLVAERYGGEMTDASLHLSQSVGKSVLGLLVGVLGLDTGELVTERVPEVAGSGYDVVAACVPKQMTVAPGVLGVPVLGSVDEVRVVCDQTGSDTVLVARGGHRAGRAQPGG